MGSQQSSHADNKTISNAPTVEHFEKSSSNSVGGLKSSTSAVNGHTPRVVVLEVNKMSLASTDEESDDDSSLDEGKNKKKWVEQFVLR